MPAFLCRKLDKKFSLRFSLFTKFQILHDEKKKLHETLVGMHSLLEDSRARGSAPIPPMIGSREISTPCAASLLLLTFLTTGTKSALTGR
jgi:hypothetical protein